MTEHRLCRTCLVRPAVTRGYCLDCEAEAREQDRDEFDWLYPSERLARLYESGKPLEVSAYL